MYNKIKNIIPHKLKIANYTAKLLTSANQDVLQKFGDDADFYVNASNLHSADAMLKVPEGKTRDEKFVIGIFDNDKMVALIDLLQNNPTQFILNSFSTNSDEKLALEILNALNELLITLKVNSLLVSPKNENIFIKSGFIKTADGLEKKIEVKEKSIQDKFFKNDKLVQLPSKPQERLEVYKIMLNWFEKNKKYSEIEINNIIKAKIECSDNATLRRDLVDNKLLNRSSDGKEYWV